MDSLRAKNFTNSIFVKQSVHCLLCGASAVRTVEAIRVADIVDVYHHVLGFGEVVAEFGGCERIDFIACDLCGLRFFWPSITGSPAFYDRLRQYGWYYSEDRSEYHFARTLISPGAVVLDVGCGIGMFASVVPDTIYTGLEFNTGAREAATEKGITVLHESIETHAARCRAAYDVVCVFQVLEHIANVRSFVEACAACAKDGGLLILSVPSADSFLASFRNDPLNLPPHHVTWWTDDCLRGLGRILGWELVVLHPEPLAPVHRAIYAQTALLRRFWRGHKIVDRSFAYRAASRLTSIAVRLFGLSVHGDFPDERGHSVTAVYRKPGGKTDDLAWHAVRN